MTKSSLQSFFELAQEEHEDFARLVQRHSIDLSCDLRNCDLIGVNFGALQVPFLDLTGCLLDGADLSKIRCPKIITKDADISDSTRLPDAGFEQKQISSARSDLFNLAYRVIANYSQYDWVVHHLVADAKESLAPIMTFYDSFAEQDYMTQRICEVFTTRETSRLGGFLPLLDSKVLCFYTRDAVDHKIDFKPSSLDASFLRAIERADQSVTIRAGRSAPIAFQHRALQKKLASAPSLPERREVFAGQLYRRLSNTILLFSGYPPISHKLYDQLLKMARRRFKLIFLCSDSVEKRLRSNERAWADKVIPSRAISEPKVTLKDVNVLSQQLAFETNNLILVSPLTVTRLQNIYNGAPLSLLQKEIVSLIDENVGGPGMEARFPFVI